MDSVATIRHRLRRHYLATIIIFLIVLIISPVYFDLFLPSNAFTSKFKSLIPTKFSTESNFTEPLLRLLKNRTRLKQHSLLLDLGKSKTLLHTNFTTISNSTKPLLRLLKDRTRLVQDSYLLALGKSHSYYCSNNLDFHPNGIARLHYVYIDPSKASGRKGGNSFQLDKSEVEKKLRKSRKWQLNRGFLRVWCPGKEDGTPVSKFTISFTGLQFSNREYRESCTTMSTDTYFKIRQNTTSLPGIVLAYSRKHFHNLFHTMTDLYSLFVQVLLYKLDFSNITILFIDGHELSPQMDPLWQNLFSGRIYRIGHLTGPVLATDMLWGMDGECSPLINYRAKDAPLVNEFREHVLHSFGLLQEDGRKLNCSSVRVTFLLRRDFGRPAEYGTISRILANEQEVLDELANNFTNIILSSQTFVNTSMRDQIKAIGLDTDVLMGMHGAGLTHVLFMQQHGALIEFFPKFYWFEFFAGLTNFRRIIREYWRNTDPKNEFSGRETRIPPGVASKMLQKVLMRMGCLKS